MKQVRTWAGLCTGAALWGSLWLAEPALAGPYVMGWGFNGNAQASPVPTSVMSNVSSIAAGYRHSLAVKDGRAWAWGDNSYLQTNVPVIAQSGVTNVAGGYSFSLALKTDGSVQAWGADIVKTNVPNSATSGVTKIAAGEWHALALKDAALLFQFFVVDAQLFLLGLQFFGLALGFFQQLLQAVAVDTRAYGHGQHLGCTLQQAALGVAHGAIKAQLYNGKHFAVFHGWRNQQLGGAGLPGAG